jgi:plasmid stabilization system protein ParE
MTPQPRTDSSTASRRNVRRSQRCRAWGGREELAPNLRSSHVGKYIIFYRPEDEGIEVIRVIHGHRDIPKLFE